jgi:hypothetical protein
MSEHVANGNHAPAVAGIIESHLAIGEGIGHHHRIRPAAAPSDIQAAEVEQAKPKVCLSVGAAYSHKPGKRQAGDPFPHEVPRSQWLG